MTPELQKHLDALYHVNKYGIKHPQPGATPHPDLIAYYKKEYGIKTDVHKMCVSCQIRHIEKYKDSAVRGEKYKFDVPCDFVPKGLPVKKSDIEKIAAEKGIDVEQAKKIALAAVDPVAWAELMFGFDDKDPKWHIRAHQKELLRCTSRRTSMIWGRRSGKSFGMAIKLIYLAFNFRQKAGRNSEGEQLYAGPTIYVITPFQSQLTGIFNDLETLIKRNSELMSAVKSGHGGSLYTKSPLYSMIFKGGTSITGFVSGIGVKGDGSGGGTLRGAGKGTVFLYLDEMDLIPEDILSKVIIPILHTSEDGVMYATSTPIGKRGRFYSWCNEKPKYKSEHYPSSVLPHWEAIEEEAREEAGTDQNFRAEYMALFIDGGYGVFKPSLVHAARADYTYDEAQADSYEFWSQRLGIPDYKNMIKTIGIDWNQNAGTEFFVVGYSPSTGKVVALESLNIPASDYSAQKWKETVIRLNYKWRPEWIYADKGWGHHIIEDLLFLADQIRTKKKRTRIDEETIHLLDRMTAFDFSKNVTLRSPVDGKTFEKSGKHFIVENAVRVFEKSLFAYPEGDKVLRDQLTNYIVARIHPSNGKPVYGCANDTIGDHRLDAMMLALAALSLECSEFAMGAGSPTQIAFAGKGSEFEYMTPEEEARELLMGARKAGVPAMLDILAIKRGNSPQDDYHIKKKWAEEDRAEEVHGRFRKKNRGNVRSSEDDKDLLQRSMSSPVKFNNRPRRGHKGSSGRSKIR